jgi:hypothetical protein
MSVNKHNLIWVLLLGTTLVFGQKQTKEINESFQVNSDVLVEIDSRHTDVTVETWNKNVVAVKGDWQVEGMTKEEASDYFENWGFEALGNNSKVVITSKSAHNYYSHSVVFDDMDFDFDFESITHLGELFDGDFYSEMIPPMPPMPIIPVPAIPAPVLSSLSEIEFDYKAYEKDKEAYMKEFEKRQKEWEREFEKKFEPQMLEYEKKMEAWEKEIEPLMKEYEVKVKKWEKEMEPQMKEYEKKMEVHSKKMEKKMKEMEKEIEIQYAQKMDEKGTKISKKYNLKKSLHIKVPKGAVVDVNAHDGKIIIPNGLKRVH